jgi:uncharacterized C2H2 Zn-finger protein
MIPFFSRVLTRDCILLRPKSENISSVNIYISRRITLQLMNDSMAFRCRRCGYTTNHKHSLVSHLQRKSPCVIIPNEVDEFPGDISIGTLLSELTSQKYTCRRRTHTGVPSGVCCPSCGRVFSFGSTLSRHRANCIKTRRENTEAEERDKKSTVSWLLRLLRIRH